MSTAESADEGILKIGQHLSKFRVGVGCPVFVTHGIQYTVINIEWQKHLVDQLKEGLGLKLSK